MQIPVVLEPLKGKGFRARGCEPFSLTAKGATREEALAKLRTKIQRRLQNGAEIVGLDIGQQNPLMEFAGMYSADDPLVQEWKKSMAEYRRKIDEHPELP